MGKIHRDCNVRLLIGALVNFAFLFPISAINVLNGGYLEIAGVLAAISAVTVVLVARVYWRGTSAQQTIAVVLTVGPVIFLFVALKLLWRGY